MQHYNKQSLDTFPFRYLKDTGVAVAQGYDMVGGRGVNYSYWLSRYPMLSSLCYQCIHVCEGVNTT